MSNSEHVSGQEAQAYEGQHGLPSRQENDSVVNWECEIRKKGVMLDAGWVSVLRDVYIRAHFDVEMHLDGLGCGVYWSTRCRLPSSARCSDSRRDREFLLQQDHHKVIVGARAAVSEAPWWEPDSFEALCHHIVPPGGGPACSSQRRIAICDTEARTYSRARLRDERLVAVFPVTSFPASNCRGRPLLRGGPARVKGQSRPCMPARPSGHSSQMEAPISRRRVFLPASVALEGLGLGVRRFRACMQHQRPESCLKSRRLAQLELAASPSSQRGKCSESVLSAF
jgi:hypothetical protein